MANVPFPYNYEPGFDIWKKSYLYDVDGDGRILFSDLTTVGAYQDNHLTGFIQYGKTAFGFDDNGEISDGISYPVIRNFYFCESQKEAGIMLLNEALKALSDTSERIYAFFHHFGMSCYARHGKLFEGFSHIHDLMRQNGFSIEHENVFYASFLNDKKSTKVSLKWHDVTSGGQKYCDFIQKGLTRSYFK